MKTITLYSPEELKELDSDAFERAYEWYKDHYCNEIPWGDEIMESLKATFKASGIRLTDWSISIYSYSYVRFDMDSDVEDLAGNRALAWLENNLLSDLRIKWTGAKRWELSKYGRYYRPGMIKPCPFTGVCFDEDMLESLQKSIKNGDTLKEAYEELASVAARLFEAELQQLQSEEEFLLQDHLTFDEDGRHV